MGAGNGDGSVAEGIGTMYGGIVIAVVPLCLLCRCGKPSDGTTPPQAKSLRQTLPRGAMKGLTERICVGAGRDGAFFAAGSRRRGGGGGKIGQNRRPPEGVVCPWVAIAVGNRFFLVGNDDRPSKVVFGGSN